LTDSGLKHHVNNDEKAPDECWLKKMHQVPKDETNT